MDLVQLLVGLVEKFPILATIVMIVGALRVINKPLFAVARAFVLSTPSTGDDKVLDSVEQSPLYKGFSFVLDWVGSIKLPAKK